MANSRIILLIDDDSIERFSIKKIITEYLEHARFISFSSGYDAIDYLTNFQSTDENCKILILLNVNLPYLMGEKFLPQFEKILIEKQELLQLHLLNSPTEETKASQALLKHNKVDSIIQKPITVEELKVLLCN
jgi:response regulator RpfG family c-di-GMP phosphodiesterase